MQNDNFRHMTNIPGNREPNCYFFIITGSLNMVIDKQSNQDFEEES